jgi:hypothetical protein
MYRVSSTWTLFLKIFLPTFWIVFFSAFAGIAIFLESETIPYFGTFSFKAGSVLFIFAGLVVLYFSLVRLKRVEFGNEKFFVTNYFKTYRYSYESIEKITEIDMVLVCVTFIHFFQKTAFGKKVFFIKRKKVWNEFIRLNPHYFAHILPK